MGRIPARMAAHLIRTHVRAPAKTDSAVPCVIGASGDPVVGTGFGIPSSAHACAHRRGCRSTIVNSAMRRVSRALMDLSIPAVASAPAPVAGPAFPAIFASRKSLAAAIISGMRTAANVVSNARSVNATTEAFTTQRHASASATSKACSLPPPPCVGSRLQQQ